MADGLLSKPHLPGWISRVLDLCAGHRYYPLVVALIAFISTTTFAFPFTIALIPAVLIAPRRWLVLGLICGMVSGFGAAVLVEAFHYLGMELIISRYPDLVKSVGWQISSDWMQSYALATLTVIAGSPIPQTPAIFFYSLANPSTLGVLVAVSIGKTAKYVFLAWLTARFPARFIGYL